MSKAPIIAALITLFAITGTKAQGQAETAGEAPRTTTEKTLCIFAHYWEVQLKSVRDDHDKNLITVEAIPQENEIRVYYRDRPEYRIYMLLVLSDVEAATDCSVPDNGNNYDTGHESK